MGKDFQVSWCTSFVIGAVKTSWWCRWKFLRVPLSRCQSQPTIGLTHCSGILSSWAIAKDHLEGWDASLSFSMTVECVSPKLSNVGASRFLPVNETTDYLCWLALEMDHLFSASPLERVWKVQFLVRVFFVLLFIVRGIFVFHSFYNFPTALHT